MGGVYNVRVCLLREWEKSRKPGEVAIRIRRYDGAIVLVVKSAVYFVDTIKIKLKCECVLRHNMNYTNKNWIIIEVISG